MYACQLFAIYGECLVSESQLFVEFSLLVFHVSSPSLGPCSPSVWVGGPPAPLMSAHWTHTCSHTPTLYTWRDIYTVCKYINKQCTYVKRDDIKLLAATNLQDSCTKRVYLTSYAHTRIQHSMDFKLKWLVLSSNFSFWTQNSVQYQWSVRWTMQGCYNSTEAKSCGCATCVSPKPNNTCNKSVWPSRRVKTWTYIVWVKDVH